MKTLLISGFAALCLAAAPAGAKEIPVKVEHGDLDLSKPGDVAKLRQRVRVAVARACRSGTVADIYPSVAGQCKEEAMAMAEAQIERRRDLALALAKDGNS